MNIRPLTSLEREAVSAFYLALSADDRRRRFCSALSDESIVRYVGGLDFERHTILGAFDEQGRIIGLTELALGANEGEGELAFSVAPDQRRQGLGSALMERILLHAGMCGIRKVGVMFFSDNAPMHSLAVRAGMQVKADGRESYASRELSAPGAENVSRRFTGEAVAHSGYFDSLGAEGCDSLASDPGATASPIREFADAGEAGGIRSVQCNDSENGC
jgi:GNAT superfamily N-acetyltransferase